MVLHLLRALRNPYVSYLNLPVATPLAGEHRAMYTARAGPIIQQLTKCQLPNVGQSSENPSTGITLGRHTLDGGRCCIVIATAMGKFSLHAQVPPSMLCKPPADRSSCRCLSYHWVHLTVAVSSYQSGFIPGDEHMMSTRRYVFSSPSGRV